MTRNKVSPPNKITYAEGEKVGACIYLGEEPSNKWRRFARFKCQCGNIFISQIAKVKNGHTKSCGCRVISHLLKMNGKHFKAKTSEFIIWVSMKQRCNNPNNKRYHRYGGRGIKVCDLWEISFENFIKDMGIRPSPKHTLDRINNDGNYEPTNCKWATQREQALNRRTNVLIEYNGEVKPLKEWTDKLNLPYSKTRRRIKYYNWPLEKAFANA